MKIFEIDEKLGRAFDKGAAFFGQHILGPTIVGVAISSLMGTTLLSIAFPGLAMTIIGLSSIMWSGACLALGLKNIAPSPFVVAVVAFMASAILGSDGSQP